MARQEFPAKVKALAFERAGGHCEQCTARLTVGKFHYDHVIPDALGGEPVLTNCAVLCTNCHGAKTHKGDVPRIAKAVRTNRKHINATRTKRPWPSRKFNERRA
jgi:5-methylcytosine-specific restriction endonuclease McrA